MVRLLTIIAIALVMWGITVSQTKTELETAGLKGPVHTVSEESRLMFDGDNSDRIKKRDSLTFNLKAQLVERVIYDDYGYLVGTEKYSHDDAGRLILAELKDSKGRLQEKKVFKYRQNQLREIITYAGNGMPVLRQAYVYRPRLNRKEEFYYSKAKALGKTSYDLDPSGNLVEASFFTAKGRKGVAPIGPCFSVHKVSYAYDGKGRVIGEVAYEVDGSVKRKSSFGYDDNGNLLEQVRVDDYSTIKFTYSYDYDAKGNWTKQTTLTHSISRPLGPEGSSEFRKKTVTTRQITYYERLDYRELTDKLRSLRNGLGDIYQIDLSELKIENKKEIIEARWVKEELHYASFKFSVCDLVAKMNGKAYGEWK